MTNPTGGTRARLISDSLYHMLHDSLASLGWFDPGRQHLPVTIREEPIALNEEVPLNTIAIEPGISSDIEREIGSQATDDTLPFYIDVYAESRSLGIHLANDIKDILRGKMPDIGRNASRLDVYDYRQATPTNLFSTYIDKVRVELAHNWPEPWRRNWFSITVVLEDLAD